MARLPEQRAWDAFSAAINPWDLKLFRVENQCVDGMSDVIGINKKGVVFWCENKALADWPAKDVTYPLRDAFEPGQLPFLRQWIHWRGHGFVLLRVKTEFMLLDPRLYLDKSTRIELINNCIVFGKKTVSEYLENLDHR
jgi:hypothetical protein